MRIFLFLLLVGMIAGCKNPADQYVKRFEMVDISKIQIPDTVVNQGIAFIRAKAQGDNDCWSHMYFEMKKTKDFEYTLKAYGTFESFGVCSGGMVYKDSTFTFEPEVAGTYRILISRIPLATQIDSIVVVEE